MERADRAPAPGGDEPPDDLEDELLECLEALAGGDSEAIERLCAARPERSAEVRERIGLLAQMNLVPNAHAAREFPERLAEFRLLRRLGSGGMGVVYEAEQEPLGRTVALKLIRPEQLYFPRARERFRRETEAVARLAHPSIVSIYTVGESSGIPYFAMELVEGATLASVLLALEHRAAEHLSSSDLRAAVEACGATIDAHAPQSAELFRGSWSESCVRIVIEMCDALAHAHSRGVLHRDIKPSNIAVTPQGRVVLLDFGLASSQDELRMTAAGSALGSVLYMAPEQVSGRTAEIDARTDVYALGVTLYELLTLRPPFAATDALSARNAILEGRPTPARLLNRRVTSELEVVCHKALARDAGERYSSMAEFGADLRAVLAGEPIRARPPSPAQRAWRWAKRRPALVAALASSGLLAVVLPSALYWQQRAHSQELEHSLAAEVVARRAASDAREQEAEQRRVAEFEAHASEQVAAFLVELFAASDPNRSSGSDLRARELLARGRERVERALLDQPELAARLLERIGESYSNLNLYGDAVPALERAVELRLDTSGERSRATAVARIALGKAQRLAGSPAALTTLRAGLRGLEESSGLASTLGVNALLELAVALSDRGGAHEALGLLERARTLAGALPPDSRRARANVLAALGVTHMRLMEFEAAERCAREALALDEQLHSGPHPSRLGDLNTLASAITSQGRLEEAQECYERLLREARVVYDGSSVATALFELNRAVLWERQGELARAEEIYRRVLAAFADRLSLTHPHASHALSNLGIVLGRQGRHREALELYEQAHDAIADRHGPQHPLARFCRSRAGVALHAMGRFDDALEQLRSALDGLTPSEAPQYGSLELALALALRRKEDSHGEAGDLARRWSDAREVELAVDAHYVLASLAFEQQRLADSAAQIARAMDRSSERTPLTWTWPALRVLRGRIALEQGRASEAWDDIESGLSELRAALGPSHIEVLDSLAWAERAAGEDHELAARLRRSVE